MKTIIVLLPFYIVKLVPLQAQETFKDYPTEPIESVSLMHPSNKDLKAIGKSIGKAQIVLLGEQDHGDATSMEFKSRLVKYLHEEKGFNVLLFESDFYSLNTVIEAQQSSIGSIKNYIQPFWSSTRAMQPLWDYLEEKNTGNVCVEVNGYAMGFSTDFAKLNASENLNKIVINNKLPFKNSPNFTFVCEIFSKLLNGSTKQINKEDQERFYTYCDTLLAQVQQYAPSDSWSKQVLYNVKAKAENSWLSNYRVKHNTANLIWLLNNKYPDKKIIIWTANIHAVKNYTALIEKDSSRIKRYNAVVDKDSVHTMSHSLIEKHRVNVYSLVYISTSGAYTPRAWVNVANSPEDIIIPENNIESLVSGSGTRYSFLNLKRLAEKKSPQLEFSMIPVLHGTTFKANWSRIFDGIIFIGNQQPLSKI